MESELGFVERVVMYFCAAGIIWYVRPYWGEVALLSFFIFGADVLEDWLWHKWRARQARAYKLWRAAQEVQADKTTDN